MHSLPPVCWAIAEISIIAWSELQRAVFGGNPRQAGICTKGRLMKSPMSAKRQQRLKRTSAARRKTARASKAKPARAGRAPDPLDELIAAAARTLDLTLEKPWLPAVRANLRVILAQAALVDEFVLPDEAEPAPVFKA
jgi:hypothetical protein